MTFAAFRLQSPSDDSALPAGAEASALSIIARLQQTIRAENDDIRCVRPADHQAYNISKSHALLELNRLAPALAGQRGSAALRTAFAALNAALEDNQRMLRTQLNAAQTISNIIAKAIRDSQSDGTYSQRSWLDDDE